MSAFYLDTEFHDYVKQHKVWGIPVGPAVNTIDLISIALRSGENHNDYYAICKDCDLDAAWQNEFLRENVLREIHRENTSPGLMYMQLGDFSLPAMKAIFRAVGKSRPQIAWEIMQFCNPEAYSHHVGGVDEFFELPFTDQHEIYTYYGAFDWVLFCWLFGGMMKLPSCFLKQDTDLHQMRLASGMTYLEKVEHCPDPHHEHHALADARWNERLHHTITRFANGYYNRN
jgi:hypothetical protein